MKHHLRRAFAFSRSRLPPGVRTVVGLVLAVLGLFGFLPVLGFWMTPLGLLIVATDIPPARRWLRRRLFRRADADPRGSLRR